ncbi:SDR family oxidoreductase [Dongia soli]|uniref:SDR family oxidoreductase n=1 Tax=Dongia soli TaxID=600628 RepID=A0ABU5EDG6_9PROT|nr:SDR family oxidoreductase [Dongia soli]MDY0884413.1 SDR family oxidoreductase [Dongia soli]
MARSGNQLLAGRVVVITGASAGVGRATAREFAKAGARLGLIARDERALEEVRGEIRSIGGEAVVAAADVADATAVFEAADKIATALGPLDIWVNNAMLTVFSPLAEMTHQEFARVTQVTYLGYVHGTMAALRHMRPRNSGTIIQVGSALAYRGIPLQAAYCGAKHAIRGFTDSLRSELIYEKSDIALTMVQLPAINTPQFDWARSRLAGTPSPVPPVIRPEVAARAIITAAQGRDREYWLGRSTVATILAQMTVPGFLDRFLARHAYDAQERGREIAGNRPDNLKHPIHALHRSRGSFGEEAGNAAALWSDKQVRIGAGVALAGLGLAIGAFAGHLIGRKSGRGPRQIPSYRHESGEAS